MVVVCSIMTGLAERETHLLSRAGGLKAPGGSSLPPGTILSRHRARNCSALFDHDFGLILIDVQLAFSVIKKAQPRVWVSVLSAVQMKAVVQFHPICLEH